MIVPFKSFLIWGGKKTIFEAFYLFSTLIFIWDFWKYQKAFQKYIINFFLENFFELEEQ